MKFPSFKFFLITILIASSDCGFVNTMTCFILKCFYTAMLATATITGELDQDLVDKLVRTCGPEAAFGPLNQKLLGLYHLRKDAENIANQLFNIQFEFKKTLLDKEQVIFSNDLIEVTAKLSLAASATAETNKDALLNVKAGEVTDKDGTKLNAVADSVSDSVVDKIQDLTGFNIKDMSFNLEKKIENLDGTFKVKATLDELDVTYSISKQVGSNTIDEDMTYAIKKNQNPNPKAETAPAISQAVDDFKTAFKQTIEPVNQVIPLVLATAAGMATISRMTNPANPATSLVPAAAIAPIVALVGMPKF